MKKLTNYAEEHRRAEALRYLNVQHVSVIKTERKILDSKLNFLHG